MYKFNATYIINATQGILNTFTTLHYFVLLAIIARMRRYIIPTFKKYHAYTYTNIQLLIGIVFNLDSLCCCIVSQTFSCNYNDTSEHNMPLTEIHFSLVFALFCIVNYSMGLTFCNYDLSYCHDVSWLDL